ncbi:hypothetical protein CVT26_000747 [Gymnopilus dilepis]|uniref:F-box domain-containing protein n=1 Tax=Gymnopilus dilepis TaxID=231916 RepID=A0A409Y2P2_9AGAR|nr:hypothetical protein CVT26_000747 [Gymnopilus dilepis]
MAQIRAGRMTICLLIEGSRSQTSTPQKKLLLILTLMALDLFDLGTDVLMTILEFLYVPDLLSLTLLSRAGFQLTIGNLVRNVKLAIGPQQVLDFCTFVTKYGLGPHIVSLTLCEPACYFVPPARYSTAYVRDPNMHQTTLFSGALADILDKASNLARLAFQNCTDLIVESEPRIPEIVCKRPPCNSLELSGADSSSLREFTSISGLTHVVLRTRVRSYFQFDIEEENAVEAILLNSIRTLKTVALGHVVPASLRSGTPLSESYERVHDLSMTETRPHVSKHHNIDQQALIYGIHRGSLDLLQNYYPSNVLWPRLRSFSGLKEVAQKLSHYHNFRRLFLMEFPFTATSQFSTLTEVARNSGSVRSITLLLELLPDERPSIGDVASGIPFLPRSVEGFPSLLDPLFAAFSSSAHGLAYLSLHTCKLEDEIPYCLYHLKRTAGLLSSLTNLKYVELGVMTSRGQWTRAGEVVNAGMEREELLQAWAIGIPSLEYLELNVVQLVWPRSWWKIDSSGRTLQQISEEEGQRAKQWFDWEEWADEE